VGRWGIEGASGLGRHTSFYLCRQGHDVRDVCPTRTAERAHGRYQGKSDALDSERIARETLAQSKSVRSPRTSSRWSTRWCVVAAADGEL
jgi:hypothetical protein